MVYGDDEIFNRDNILIGGGNTNGYTAEYYIIPQEIHPASCIVDNPPWYEEYPDDEFGVQYNRNVN